LCKRDLFLVIFFANLTWHLRKEAGSGHTMSIRQATRLWTYESIKVNPKKLIFFHRSLMQWVDVNIFATNGKGTLGSLIICHGWKVACPFSQPPPWHGSQVNLSEATKSHCMKNDKYKTIRRFFCVQWQQKGGVERQRKGASAWASARNKCWTDTFDFFCVCQRIYIGLLISWKLSQSKKKTELYETPELGLNHFACPKTPFWNVHVITLYLFTGSAILCVHGISDIHPFMVQNPNSTPGRSPH